MKRSWKFWNRAGRNSSIKRRQIARKIRKNNVTRSADLSLESLEPRWVLTAGALDTTFGASGTVIGDFATTLPAQFTSMAIQADGKIVAAGMLALPEQAVVGRFNADGSVDATFGTGGFTQFRFNNQQSFLNDVAIDSSGRIIVVGQGLNVGGTQTGFAIARLTSTGVLDSTFGTVGVGITGRVVSAFSNAGFARGVTIQSDGKIVVAGQLRVGAGSGSSLNDFAVLRYDANGVLDSTFGASGLVTTDFALGLDAAYDVTTQMVGAVEKIVVAGRASRPLSAVSDFAMARYNPNGSLDSIIDADPLVQFGLGGKVTAAMSLLSSSLGSATGYSLAVDQLGRFIMGGSVGDSSASDMVAARFSSNGVLDIAAFNPLGLSGSLAGTQRINFSQVDGALAVAVAVQPDGQYVIGGDVRTTASTPTATWRNGLARLNASNGSLDTSFGTGGLVQVPTFIDGGGANDNNNAAEPESLSLAAMAMQADGKIVTAGYIDLETVNRDYLLARYDSGLMTADAGGPYTINEPGGNVVLSGTQVGGTGPFTFQWDLDGDNVFGETGVGATRGNETGANPTFTVSGVDGPNDVFTVTVKVTDANLVVATDTATVQILNVSPTLAISGASSVNEGATYTLNLSSSDPGPDTITSWTINWGVGAPQVVAGNPSSVTHIYPDGLNNYTITASATDEDGTFAAGNNVPVTVNNVAPTLTLAGTSSVNEGALYTLNLSSSDPGADTITSWTINWGDGSEVVLGNPSLVTHTYLDGLAIYTISATATDEDGTFAAGNSVAVTVNNVAPTLVISGAANVNEGSAYTLNLVSADDGTDTITSWTINWGDSVEVVSGNPSSANHTYADGPNSYTISATATDEDGAYSAGNTVAVSVDNVAPTLAISGASSANEGSSYTLNLSSTDPGADTISSWTINWGDGTQVVSGNPSSVTHTYADGPNSYTISASATDEDGTFAAGNTVSVTVNNVAPTLAISGAATVNEGSVYTLNLSSSDPGADTIANWTIDWGDGIEVVSGSPSSVTHTYADGPNSYAISATATDEDGTFAAGNTVAVAVANVAPTLTISGVSDVNEGSAYTLSLSASDPGADTITSWTINWGDSVQVVSGNPASVNHTYADGDNNYTISATATDEDGTFAAVATVAVMVHNVAPTLTISGASDVNEGSVYTLNLTSSDPGADTITSWSINWGDSIQVVSGNPSSVTHTYADGDNNYTISATADDEDGTFAAVATVAVMVHNVAPTLTITGGSDVNEGSSYTLNLSASDPGADTITTWTINWGDSTQVVSGNPASVSHTYADGENNYNITASATDEDGTYVAGNSVAVAVHNVAPTLAISGAASVNEGSSYTLNLSSSDPGADTITSWTINWGDSTQVVSGSPASVNHTYADGTNNYTISATATDEDGTFAAVNTVAVAVNNVAPTLSISGAPSVNEGSSYTLNLSSSDPGTDTISSWTINWGDSTQVVSGNPASVTHTYADGTNNYTISATATDEDGTFAAGNTVAVTVNNVAPALSISGASSVNEGSVYTLTLSRTDPGADTISSWTINWGDGTQVVSGNPASVSHTYADGTNNYTISATATDEDGTYAAGNTVAVTVNNVAPTLAISGAASVNEGSPYTLTLSRTDPGADTITSWTINWGDSVVQTFFSNPSSVTHTYADGGNPNTVYTISASATDEDGTYAAGNTKTVTVNNSAPTANAGGPYFTFEDTPIALSGSGTDPAGAADPLTYQWDLDNDGIFGETGGGATRGNEVGATPTFNPTSLGTTSYTVKLKVNDGDGGTSAVSTATVQILGSGSIVIGGVLYVVGTNDCDIAIISQCNDQIIVLATFNQNNPMTFNAAGITEINVRLRDGADILVTTPNVTKKMTIDGGGGNDLLTGGGGTNLILGGAGHDALYGGDAADVLLGGDGNDDLFGGGGNDALVGGNGRDILNGGIGRDLLIGSQDEDRLEGGDDEDILIGGYTIHDNNLAALDAVMAIWTSSASFNARVASLTASGGLLQAGVTVFDDDDQDTIIGGAGRDLIFGDTSMAGDGVKDMITLQSMLDKLVALN